MNNFLEEAKQLLKQEPRLDEDQWQMLNKLLMGAGDQTDSVLRWVFADHAGYTEVRVRAGLEFFRRNPAEGWSILEYLVTSDDADNRDTALGVLVASEDPRAPQLARSLLTDPWPYLQFDAADFLEKIYRVDVIATLQVLLKSNEDEWIRDEAQKRLIRMGASVPPS